MSSEEEPCLPASMASSLSWWRRWRHAEAALYPLEPTQVSRLLILTGNLSTAGSGEACQGQLSLDEENNSYLKRILK